MSLKLPFICFLELTSFSETDNIMRSYDRYFPDKKISDIKKFRFIEDRARGFFAYLLAKFVVAGLQHTHAELIQFSEGKYGKPAIASDTKEKIKINLSHSKNFISLLVDDEEVGIDLEYTREIDVFKDNSYMLFMRETEIKEFREEKSTYGMLDYYYTIWTGKESIMKYTGLGVNMEPKHISLNLGCNKINNIKKMRIEYMDNSIVNLLAGCNLYNFVYKEDYMVSLCFNAIEFPEVYYIGADEFIETLDRGSIILDSIKKQDIPIMRNSLPGHHL